MKVSSMIGYILLMMIQLGLICFTLYSMYTIITTLYITGHIYVMVWFILGWIIRLYDVGVE